MDRLDLHDDFHISNSVANVHLWLIMQRLRDFANNKFAYQLRNQLVETFDEFITKEMDEVAVLRKHKKIEQLNNYLFAIR